MTEVIKKHPLKLTNIILLFIFLGTFIYIAELQGWINLHNEREVTLVEKDVLITLDAKEKTYIGVNNKQIYKVTTDGITTYDFDKEEIWSDTLSLNSIIVKQRTPYIAIGSRNGKNISVFNEKGKQVEINTASPIIYFSINEKGNVVTIEENEKSHVVTSYDTDGKFICKRTSFIENDGYPIVAEVSPDGTMLLINYISYNEPQVVSTLLGINTQDKQTEQFDNIKYGIKQKDNLVYAIEFINNNTWISVGDKETTWYDLQGEEQARKEELYAVFSPQVIEKSKYGQGYLPMIVSQKPMQNIIHRQDQLLYFDVQGEETFRVELSEGAENFYWDANGVVYKSNGEFKGYDRLGNSTFTYRPTLDVSKVIYFPNLKKGIAVNKEKVILLKPKKEEGENG